MALTFLAISLIGTSFGVSVVYQTAQAKRTSVRRLYGWSLWRTCRRAFAIEAVLYTGLVVLFLLRVRDAMADVVDPIRASQTARVLTAEGVSIVLTITVAGVSLLLLLRAACSAMERSRIS